MPKKDKNIAFAENYVRLKILSVYELEAWNYVKIHLHNHFWDGIWVYMADIQILNF